MAWHQTCQHVEQWREHVCEECVHLLGASRATASVVRLRDARVQVLGLLNQLLAHRKLLVGGAVQGCLASNEARNGERLANLGVKRNNTENVNLNKEEKN
jgi:hypothetical protein